MEVYVPTMRQLLNEKNHGVLLTGVCLVTEMCRVNPDSLNHFKRVSRDVCVCGPMHTCMLYYVYETCLHMHNDLDLFVHNNIACSGSYS